MTDLDLVQEFRAELKSIAEWWIEHTLDTVNGGFIGEISVDNQLVVNANKGIILNTRILWFFSEAAIFADVQQYQQYAKIAYDYLRKNFTDSKNGGVYWELNVKGKVVNARKQIYAQAFAIYGLCSYYKMCEDKDALALANKLFELIEDHAHDDVNKGYVEAFTENWGPLKDFRLSEKDLNSPKSMNTHLHILEAYTSLYRLTKDERVGFAVRRCLTYFDEFLINKESWHLRMFQSISWKDLSESISYGHDIESSWLIWEALEVLEDEKLKAHYLDVVLKLAETCLNEGVGEHNEVFDAYNFKTDSLIEERVWWVQAEALVGFLTAFYLSEDPKYYDAAVKVWEFIKRYQKDDQAGEWLWLSRLDMPHVGDCKMGFWKAPYHNGRAMMEACKLMAKIHN